MKLRVKYLQDATRMNKITKGNWIDVYAYQDIFVPEGERAMINLGFALELPKGWEGHLAPRSSTFKTWGIIQTNHVGVVDDTYIGDNDIWHIPVYCLQGKDFILKDLKEQVLINKIADNDFEIIKNGVQIFRCVGDDAEEHIYNHVIKGTWIRKGDKIGQFRIMEVMPEIEFEEVEFFNNIDRGGFGTTGVK